MLALADERAAELAERQLELIQLENAGEDTRRIEARIRELEARTIEPESNRIILGMGIQSLFFRTDEGETIRIMGPGGKVVLYVFPIGERTLTNASPNIQRMTVVDDCTTDVYIFDSETVYVSFDALQRLNNMGAVERLNGGFEPGRCSMINIKAAKGYEDTESIKQLRNRLRAAVERFIQRHPDMPEALQVLTWWEKQEKITAQLESQRVLLIMMLGIISLVSVLLMFVILYMVVMQKIRDIGVLKAVGASNCGVGMIFLQFGGMVGMIGAIIGAAGGCVFIHYINQIHDWLYDSFGLRVWTRESYMFDRIPAEIDPLVVAMMIVGAVAASVIGAVVPSLRAARMQPVEALRYE